MAYELLSRKAWTHRELLLRLQRRGAPAPIAEDVIKDLEQQGYVDDQAFALAWAETRARQRHLGGRRLRQELVKKGVAPSAVENAIEQAFGPSGEEAEALVAARREWPRLLRRGAEKAPRRLRDHLLRRGFSAELVEPLVKQMARLEM
ncbi:MAG TPA: regulatory protein RecX [Methylomirabilota bacterium]|nr:regulatory protein RecX [Methylomirabilota bacterium]